MSYRAAKLKAYEVWPRSIVLLVGINYKGGIDYLDMGWSTVYVNSGSALWWAVKRWFGRK